MQWHSLHCALDCPHPELHVCVLSCCVAAEAISEHYGTHTACKGCAMQQVTLTKGAALHKSEVGLMKLLQVVR
jgi:hypothetical protein